MYKKSLALLLIVLGMVGSAFAEDYPVRPITLVVVFSAGGPSDTVARTIAASMQKRLKQEIVVETVAGAGGTLGSARVARASPDGYTILLHHIGLATAAALHPDLAFDPMRDFEFIGEVTHVPMTLIGRKGLPVKNVKELVQYMKANKSASIAHAGPGAASYLCSLLLMDALDLEIKTKVYKGTALALDDVLNERVDILCDQTTSTIPHIRNNKITVFGTTTSDRVPLLPGVPTLEEQGIPNFEIAVWHALYAPKGTPRRVVEKLNDALRFALSDATVRARFNDLGTHPVHSDRATPAYAQSHLQAEIKRWTPIILKARKHVD